MARFLLKDPRPLIQSFICPVTQVDSVKYTGCEATNAKFEKTTAGGGGLILGRFKCACGKNLLTRVLVDDIELTHENYKSISKVEPKPV